MKKKPIALHVNFACWVMGMEWQVERGLIRPNSLSRSMA